MRKILFIFCIILLYPCSSVFAIEGYEAPIPPDELDIVKLILYLILVIVLIYVFFYFLKKNKRLNSSSIFNTFGGMSMGQNKSVQVVEIGNKIYILGVGQEITLIKVLENKDDINAIKNISYGTNTGSKKMISKISNKYIKRNKNNNLNIFEKELSEKMEQLKEKRTFTVNQFLDEEERENKRD